MVSKGDFVFEGISCGKTKDGRRLIAKGRGYFIGIENECVMTSDEKPDFATGATHLFADQVEGIVYENLNIHPRSKSENAVFPKFTCNAFSTDRSVAFVESSIINGPITRQGGENVVLLLGNTTKVVGPISGFDHVISFDEATSKPEDLLALLN